MSKSKGPVYGGSNSRPVGDGGRGRHTGKVGYLGGKHAKRNCLDVFVLLVGLGTSLIVGATYGVVHLVQVIV